MAKFSHKSGSVAPKETTPNNMAPNVLYKVVRWPHGVFIGDIVMRFVNDLNVSDLSTGCTLGSCCKLDTSEFLLQELPAGDTVTLTQE